MSRTSRLDIRTDGASVALTGRVDDSAAFDPALFPAGAAIDTSGVTFVNSVGMREWLRLVRALRANGPVRLERVADVLMTQMNMIPEFKTSVTIASFYAQYACPACGAEPAMLVDAEAHAAELRAMQAPKLRCPECGDTMALADFPERYLSIFR